MNARGLRISEAPGFALRSGVYGEVTSPDPAEALNFCWRTIHASHQLHALNRKLTMEAQTGLQRGRLQLTVCEAFGETMNQVLNMKASDQRRELIAFRIGAQEYCVDIMMVREIRGWTPATPLPHAQSYMRGVINLRGTVLPIIDLSERLGLGTTIAEARHVIIVVRCENREVGLLVDAVCDILSVTDEEIQPTPSVASETVRSFVRGILAVDGRMIGVVALDRILPDEFEAEAA